MNTPETQSYIYGSTLEDLRERGRQRRLHIQSHQAKSFQDAEEWDLEYWQKVGPIARLDAYMAIRDDVEKVNRARNANRI